MKVSSFSIILSFACLMILGLFLIPKLPVKLNPSRELPVVNIVFSMPGQSARVVEMEVTSKVEAMLSRIKGVQEVRSISSAGRGRVTVRLSKHVDPDMARFEISTVIRQTWPSLPEGVGYPSIYMSGSTSNESVQPYLRYTVNAPFSPMQIQEYIDDNLKPKLAEIRDIDRIDVSGASRMIYKLEYDYILLQNLKISLNDIRTAINSYLGKEFLGIARIADENNDEQWIRIALISEDRTQAFDPSLIQVKNIEGKIIYLDNIVKTTYEEEEVSSFFRINGLNSIYLSLTAKENANQLELSKFTKETLERYKKELPEGYELHLSYDAGEYLQEEMDKIYFRSGLTVLILLCFVFFVYRNLKYSLLVVSSLTANIAIAVIFYYLFGLEMQLYSLAGLTISLNLIIDNTIIMSDQIIRRGNKKAFLAILAATLTSIGALSVILFMDEKIRVNMQDFAWVVIINLSISLFIALFLVPAIVDKLHLVKTEKKPKKRSLLKRLRNRWAFLKRITRKLRGKRIFVYLNRIYEKIIIVTQKRKRWIVAGLILAFGLPVFMLPDKVGERKRNYYYISDENSGYWAKLYNKTIGSALYKEKIKPISDVALGGTFRLFAQKVRNGSYASGERSETALYVTASGPNGSTKEQMNVRIQRMEDYIRQYSEVKQFETHIESGQRASIRILFVKQHQRSGFPYRLKSRLIGKANELGGGAWSVYGVGDGFNNDVREQAGSSRLKLLGYNYDELQSLSEMMRDSLLKERRIKEITIDSRFSWYKTDYSEFVFDLNKEKLAYNRLLPVQLFNSFSPLFGRNLNSGQWIHNNKTEYIRLYSKQSNEFDIWNMENFQSKIEEQEYKLVDIANIEKWQAPREIAKENQQYLLCVQYEYIGAYQQSSKVMQKQINSFNEEAPLGYKAASESYQYWWGDSASKQYRLLFLIILIIFFMASILFNSLTQPLIVLFIVPVSYIGLFLTFYLFKLNFDQGGFAAFILLTGISVNANIYVLNEYNNIRRKKPLLKPLKAYIKAWNAKVLPIFLTIFSSVLGFIPFMIGEYKEAFWFPLAAGTVGGLIMSFVTLFLFLPLFMGVGKKALPLRPLNRSKKL
ncbi:MAG: efflux RND transporter permease subunit [Prevotellaceae bacterium]|jgi:multidrug efflux pump subunit AcrB|nr:efflux RND transporter permease subunit [Prevotellaceae bacterium]